MSTTETTAPVEQTAKERKPRGPSPSQEQFGLVWNAASDRNDVIKRLAAAGFTVSYSAMVARAKSLKEKGVHLKDMPALKRGRQTDVAALNAKLDSTTPA